MLLHKFTVRCWQGSNHLKVEWDRGIYFRGLPHMAGQRVLAVGRRPLGSLPCGPLHRFVGCLEDPEVGSLQSEAKRARWKLQCLCDSLRWSQISLLMGLVGPTELHRGGRPGGRDHWGPLGGCNDPRVSAWCALPSVTLGLLCFLKIFVPISLIREAFIDCPL